MKKPPAMILAGGRATRMGGGDKGLLRVGGRALIARAAERLAPQSGPIALNANGDPARFDKIGLPVVPDSFPDQPGPLAGILAAMEWSAAMGAPAVVTVAADTPFFPADLVARLTDSAGTSGLAIAASRDSSGAICQHPVFGLWPISLRDSLRAALSDGRRRVRGFADAHSPTYAVWPCDTRDPFFNINAPGDLALAEAMAADMT